MWGVRWCPTITITTTYLFVLTDGKEFAHGTLSRRISIIFERAGIALMEGLLPSNGTRKAFATMAFGLARTKKRVVNRHMSHHENTADSNYVAAYSADRASQAHSLISDIVNNPHSAASTSTLTSNDPESEEVETEEEVPRSLPQRGLSEDSEIMIRTTWSLVGGKSADQCQHG